MPAACVDSSLQVSYIKLAAVQVDTHHNSVGWDCAKKRLLCRVNNSYDKLETLVCLVCIEKINKEDHTLISLSFGMVFL
jgi:hypothetical protein